MQKTIYLPIQAPDRRANDSLRTTALECSFDDMLQLLMLFAIKLRKDALKVHQH